MRQCRRFGLCVRQPRRRRCARSFINDWRTSEHTNAAGRVAWCGRLRFVWWLGGWAVGRFKVVGRGILYHPGWQPTANRVGRSLRPRQYPALFATYLLMKRRNSTKSVIPYPSRRRNGTASVPYPSRASHALPNHASRITQDAIRKTQHARRNPTSSSSSAPRPNQSRSQPLKSALQRITSNSRTSKPASAAWSDLSG